MSSTNSDYYFLKGGGEMGKLIREKDWSETSLGDPDNWPKSLQTMVAMMLNNPFAMYIVWGSEYTQLYNDGYRPILGASKHPQALGISPKETFSEIYDIIGPMFDDVMKGNSVGFHDLLLPLNRNGFLEDCYFDFSYSPIRKDDGEVGGVLVTVVETTNKKKAEDALRESEARFRAMADDAPVFIFLAGENAEVEYLNKTWRDYTGAKDDYKGRAWAEITHIDDVEPATKIYMDGFNKRETCSFENRQKGTDGIYRTIFWTATPRFTTSGQFIGMMGVGLDIHERKKSEEKLRESEQKVRSVVENAPFPIAVYVGKEMIVELANQSIIDIWGKGNDVIGKSFKEILPELDNQLVFEQIQKVFETGESFHTKNTPLDLIIEGKPYTYYFNYSFTPLYDVNGNIYGVMNTGVDLTELNLAKKRIEESDKRFRTTVKQAPVGITILRGPEFMVEMANEIYLALVDKKESTFVGRPLFDSLPESKNAVSDLLSGVLKTGIAYHGNEVPVPLNRFGNIGILYFDFLYAPLKEEDGTISGIIVTVTEVTEKVEVRKKVEDSEKRYNLMLMQSPFAFLILKGKDFVVHLANESMKEVLGKGNNIEGKPLLEIVPELKGQEFPDLLEKVLNTGTAVSANEMLAQLKRNDNLDDVYFNYVYQPYYEADNTISGVTVIAYDVTASVIANKKIEASELRLNIVVEASELGTYELNLKTHEPTYSQRYLEILGGYKENVRLTYAQLVQHLHPDDLSIRDNAFQEAYKTGHLHYEARSIWNDNSIHWMEGKGKIFYDEEHNPSKLIGTIRDITAEKNHEQELKESEEKFKTLADQAPMWVWLTDPEVNILYTNPEVLKFLGISHYREFSGNIWEEKVHPEDIALVYQSFSEAASYQRSFDFEFRVLNALTQQYEWFYIKAVPRLEGGECTGFIGTGININEQKSFAKELKEQVITRTAELKASEEKFYNLFNLSPISKTLSDSNSGKIVMVNDSFTKLFGYKSENVIGKSSAELGLLDLEMRELIINELKTNGKIDNREITFIKKSGEKFVALASAELINIGGTPFFLSAFNDISDIKTAEQNIKQKNIELEKMNKELQSFAYISSHDLQEPLRKIQTFSSRIRDKELDNLSDSGKDMFSRMNDAAKRMQTLIQDLLAYSRTNATEPLFETTDLNDIITEIKKDLEEELQEKNAVIESNELGHVDIIPFQFRQLMHNLIGNSLKFSQPDVPPIIKIESEIAKGLELNNDKLSPQKKYCHIAVSDNGIGIEQQYSEKIFEVFQRLHAKNEYNGTGIGLSIVKKIVENHHGIITANGELNKGVTFDIYIPAK